MPSELATVAERTVLVAVVTGLVSYVTAQWRAARTMKNAIGSTVEVVQRKVEGLGTAIDVRLAAIEQKQALAAEIHERDQKLVRTEHEARLAPLERAVFGPTGLEAQMRLANEAQQTDRIAIHGVQQQLANIAAMLGELRGDVRRALDTSRTNPPGGTDR